jgi:hypothetical protein
MAACAFVGRVDPARAVIIAIGDGTGNTTAPTPMEQDPGFLNVGATGPVSAVYLGSGWVLTVGHSSITNTTFDGVTYELVANSGVRLQNPEGSGQTQNTDLIMYQIQGDPDLPRPRISAYAPDVGSQLTMIGRGRNREANLTNWTAIWTETPLPSTYSGYKAAPGQTIRWGQNQIDETGQVVQVMSGSEIVDVNAFAASFDGPGEAVAITGDSGGGAFYFNQAYEGWEMAGTLFAVEVELGQPANTAVFGNRTFMVDLSVYREQILELNPIPADINDDLFVDIFDVGLVSDNWENPGGTGDVNGDGIVDIFDIGIISDQWQPMQFEVLGAGDAGGPSSVPEPSTVSLLATGGILTWLTCSRRRSAWQR